MKGIICLLGLGLALAAIVPATAQIRPTAYLGNAHSHNDYTRNHPFSLAYGLGFGSIEADIFLRDGELYVAHTAGEITEGGTFDALYLQPILRAFADASEGWLYPDSGQLQLLVDLKTEGTATLKALEEKLLPYRAYFDSKRHPKAVKIVISGNMPAPDRFADFDGLFFFDGRPGMAYTPDQLERIGLFSASFHDFSRWNGLGRLTETDLGRVRHVVDSVHRLGKKMRFWASPDTKTTWYEWVKLGIDYINTDNPMGLAAFLTAYPKLSYQAAAQYTPYEPLHAAFRPGAKPRNVILLISDGAGLSQLWAAATANGGRLNVLGMPYTGYLFTGSADNYHTDSAAGGTALATGSKTRNRAIGVDTLGKALVNLPERLATRGIVSGIVSNDGVTGATPSSFYAHRAERDMADSIASDLLRSPLSLVVGGFDPVFAAADSALVRQLRQQGFEVQQGLEGLGQSKSKRVLSFAEDQVSGEWDKLSAEQGNLNTSYRMIEDAFERSVAFLKDRAGDKGFFLMVEGAKIDGGGHGNSVPFTVTEYLSFDKVVGKALEFADADGETLVIVTSDHETGGLIVLDGDYRTGYVLGDFATTDHTGLPVPLAAYGPGAEYFQGFVDNSELAGRIVQLIR
ncbi:alkaline phosphatase [Parapedobacter sp. DT-150]|uniref:alkaline phosphatase n=1 Tax=Parapedobacter sp. DT-150 TaxID=3396162 RepID=UPI003F1A45B5